MHAFLRRVDGNVVCFNRPCDSDDSRLPPLVDGLTRHALKFRTLKRNRKTVHAFVSACIEKLRTGYSIGGVEMYPHDPFVWAHAPDELLHGPLGGMRCRYMSAASLMIAKESTSDAGLPLRHMRY